MSSIFVSLGLILYWNEFSCGKVQGDGAFDAVLFWLKGTEGL